MDFEFLHFTSVFIVGRARRHREPDSFNKVDKDTASFFKHKFALPVHGGNNYCIFLSNLIKTLIKEDF